MNKKDLSIIALIFFITRTFYNLTSFNNIYSFLIISSIIYISIFIIKKTNIDILKYKLIKLLFLLIIISTYILIIINTSQFISINYFRYDNFFVVITSLLITSYFLGKNKIKVLASISEIFLVFFIISSLIISIGLISQIDSNNLINYFNNSITINLLPFLIIPILYYLKNNNLIIGFSFGIISVLIDSILIIGNLGTKLVLQYKFPGISILKSLNFFNFINHLDKLFSFIYLFEYIITLSLIFFIIKDIIKKSLSPL